MTAPLPTADLPTTDLPGFADPVTDAQSCFRAVLTAISHPGRICQVRPAPCAPAPLGSAAAAAVLTLVDAETPLALDAETQAARPWIVFHCGAPIVPLEQAQFALLTQMPPLDALFPGTDEVPEGGATILLQVPALGSGPGYVLDGPGLPAPHTLRVAGLPAGFAATWQANRARFPRGIDLILCAGDQMAALPRSVTVQEA